MRNLLRLVLLLLVGLVLPSQAEDLNIDRFCLENNLGPTKVEELGLDAYTCYWPADVDYKEAQVELIVASLDAEGLKQVKESGSSPYQMMLTNFTGIFSEPESINKTLFVGSTGARQVYHSKIPRKNTVNTSSKYLDDGSFVFVAVRSFKTPNPKAAKLITAIANTFRVR